MDQVLPDFETLPNPQPPKKPRPKPARRRKVAKKKAVVKAHKVRKQTHMQVSLKQQHEDINVIVTILKKYNSTMTPGQPWNSSWADILDCVRQLMS